MDHQLAYTHSNDVSAEVAGTEPSLAPDMGIRSLQDLELVLVSGGTDAAPIWP